jgi:cellulose synthase/poly-beta-1,6-N-acetylglucosamine synthase-like glycosyltransferase
LLELAYPFVHLSTRIGLKGTRYFQEPDHAVSKNRKIIAIGIPTYNEQRHELKRTLDSLNECVGHKLVDQNYGGQLYFCPVQGMRLEGYYATALIVLDGLKATSASMQAYLEVLFGAAFSTGPTNPVQRRSGYVTFITERKPMQDGERHALLPNLHLYLLVKVDNRKKHNSHEWFLRSHCTDVRATFALCTDCGTYFDKACLKELTRYLEDHNDVAACCGRQRIMEKVVQDRDDPGRDERVGEYLL